MIRRVCRFLAMGLAAALGLGVAGAESVKNEPFAFRFEVPSKLRAKPPAPGERTMLYQFTDRAASATDPATVVQLIRKRVVVAQGQRLEPEDFLAGTGLEGQIAQFAVRMEEFNWRGLPLDQMRLVLPASGGQMVLYAVCYPFSGEAVQLQVAGPESRDTEVRAIFEQVAHSVENQKPLAGTRPAGSRENAGAMLTVVIIMILVVGAVVGVAIRLQKRAFQRIAEDSTGL